MSRILGNDVKKGFIKLHEYKLHEFNNKLHYNNNNNLTTT
jgi:hypothetical protein